MIEIILSILLFIIIFLIVLFPLSLSLSFVFGAPFVTTPSSIIKEMIKFAKINSEDTVIDLGSGDGRVLFECAKICKKAIGYEINPFLVAWAKIIILTNSKPSKAGVKWQNYNNANLSQANVVFLYSIRGFLPKLENKLKKELQPNTKIVSYKFPLFNFKLIKKTKTNIYLYAVN